MKAKLGRYEDYSDLLMSWYEDENMIFNRVKYTSTTEISARELFSEVWSCRRSQPVEVSFPIDFHDYCDDISYGSDIQFVLNALDISNDFYLYFDREVVMSCILKEYRLVTFQETMEEFVAKVNEFMRLYFNEEENVEIFSNEILEILEINHYYIPRYLKRAYLFFLFKTDRIFTDNTLQYIDDLYHDIFELEIKESNPYCSKFKIKFNQVLLYGLRNQFNNKNSMTIEYLIKLLFDEKKDINLCEKTRLIYKLNNNARIYRGSLSATLMVDEESKFKVSKTIQQMIDVYNLIGRYTTDCRWGDYQDSSLKQIVESICQID